MEESASENVERELQQYESRQKLLHSSLLQHTEYNIRAHGTRSASLEPAKNRNKRGQSLELSMYLTIFLALLLIWQAL